MAAELTCSESEELLALAALGVLTRAEGAPLDEHLRGCVQCRRSATEYLQATAALPSALNAPEPPPTLRRNLLREVYGSDAPHTRPDGAWAPLRRTLTRRRLFEAAGAAVTVAAVVVALVAVTRPVDEQRSYTIVGTTSAPAVQGTLAYDSQTQQAVMTVTGLPPPEASGGAPPQVYEVWLVGVRGAPEGVAFLSQSPVNRSWTTVIHSDLSQYIAVAATQEPYGGSPKPTSPQLLSVQLTR